MLERERHQLIARLAAERGVIGATELCELLGASEATIRRDIAAMSDRGEVRRVRGGVEALHPRFQPHLAGVPLSLSRDRAVPEKRAIARAAAALVAPDESLIIGAGSTTFCLAEALSELALDILTPSFPLAAALLRGRHRVSLPGGTVYREQSIVLSPFECAATRHFRAGRMLLSCFGLGPMGLMEHDPLIVQSQLRLLAQAERVTVLADAAKFRQRSSTIVIPLSRIDTLVTDAGATAAELEPFRAAGIPVVIAAAAEAAADAA